MAFTTIPGAEYGADTAFIGTESVDTIAIVGLEGSAYLAGEAEGDIINVANFTNIVSDYTLKGGQGNDSINVAPTLNDSFIAGNLGNDTIRVQDTTGTTLQGGQGNDTIIPRNVTGSLIAGNLGNDTLRVNNVQVSSVWGGQGNDSITVSGSIIGSTVEGNLANDVIRIEILAAADEVFVNSTVSGGLGNDTITADNTAGFLSTVGLVIQGNEGNDLLAGGNGADNIDGGDDFDVISGGAGTDTLNGGAGNDTIDGGADADTLIGGGGSNVFNGTAAESYTGVALTGTSVIDVITDWTAGGTTAETVVDRLDYGAAATYSESLASEEATFAAALTAVNAGAGMTTGYELFAVGTGTSFSAILFIDANGDNVADGAVQLGATGTYGSAASVLNAFSTANIVV